jgi:hypothetical protein
VNAFVAERALLAARNDLPTALVMLKNGVSPQVAQRALAATGGNVRQTLASLKAKPSHREALGPQNSKKSRNSFRRAKDS